MVEEINDDLLVIADNPEEMVSAQHAMVARVNEKLDAANAELTDATESLDALAAAGMATSAAERTKKRCIARIEFLAKTKAALDEGYVIVPEMPCDIIAIRVKRRPRRQHEVARHSNPSISIEDAPGLPAGEGEYVDPVPPTKVVSFANAGEKGNETHYHRTTTGEWDSEIQLPATFLRATIVKRTGKCMMRRLFDEIAVVGAPSVYSNFIAKKLDPMVIGSIVDRARKRKLWFLIAWFVDTSGI